VRYDTKRLQVNARREKRVTVIWEKATLRVTVQLQKINKSFLPLLFAIRSTLNFPTEVFLHSIRGLALKRRGISIVPT